jgi:hypothetical protein
MQVTQYTASKVSTPFQPINNLNITNIGSVYFCFVFDIQ